MVISRFPLPTLWSRIPNNYKKTSHHGSTSEATRAVSVWPAHLYEHQTATPVMWSCHYANPASPPGSSSLLVRDWPTRPTGSSTSRRGVNEQPIDGDGGPWRLSTGNLIRQVSPLNESHQKHVQNISRIPCFRVNEVTSRVDCGGNLLEAYRTGNEEPGLDTWLLGCHTVSPSSSTEWQLQLAVGPGQRRQCSPFSTSAIIRSRCENSTNSISFKKNVCQVLGPNFTPNPRLH